MLGETATHTQRKIRGKNDNFSLLLIEIQLLFVRILTSIEGYSYCMTVKKKILTKFLRVRADLE